jgi:hypothetical protein
MVALGAVPARAQQPEEQVASPTAEVVVGQRWVFEHSGPLLPEGARAEVTYVVRGVVEGVVTYDVLTVTHMGEDLDPIQQVEEGLRWSATAEAGEAAGDDLPDPEVLGRERVEVGDLELVCLRQRRTQDGVTRASWVAIDGDQLVFPGVVRAEQDGELVLNLVRVEFREPSPIEAPTLVDGPMNCSVEELQRAFSRGRAISIEVRYDSDAATPLRFNTTVDVATCDQDGDGPFHMIMTSNYLHAGVEHYFCIRLRDGGVIDYLDLIYWNGSEWEAVPEDVFWFDVGPESSCVAESGALALRAAGSCNGGRGSTTMRPAKVVLRARHLPDADPVDY